MSLFRLITLSSSGSMRLINLSKVSAVDMNIDKKTITYIMDNVKTTFGASAEYGTQYKTQEETRKAFDEVHKDLFKLEK